MRHFRKDPLLTIDARRVEHMAPGRHAHNSHVAYNCQIKPHFSLVTIAPLLATTRVLVRALASVVVGATNKHHDEVFIKQQAQVVPSGLRLGLDVLELGGAALEGGRSLSA